MSGGQFSDGSGQATECRRKLRRQLARGHGKTTTISGQAVVDDVGITEEVAGDRQFGVGSTLPRNKSGAERKQEKRQLVRFEVDRGQLVRDG